MSGAQAEVSKAPERAPLVLTALILVAAVANLNLSVANVALPSIGKAFDSSQTTLNLIAVGLLPGAGRVGALPRGRGRPPRPQDDAHPRHPALGAGLPARVVRLGRLGARRGADPRRPVGRHGLPDDAGADHRAVVRSRPDEVDRPVVGARRRDRRARAAGRRLPAGVLLVGVGLPDHPPARGGRAADGVAAASRRTSTSRPSRSTTSAGSSRSCSSPAWCSRSTSPPCRAREPWSPGWR